MNNPIVCEKCEEEKSPFEMVVSEHGIAVNGEDWLANLLETTPMVVCGLCEDLMVEFAYRWDQANEEAETNNFLLKKEINNGELREKKSFLLSNIVSGEKISIKEILALVNVHKLSWLSKYK